jgi:hypothetical protein
MNIAYRTYLYTPESERIKLVPNGYLSSITSRQRVLWKNANQDIQLIEAQIVADKDGAEVLRSIKLWYLTLDAEGYLAKRRVNQFDAAELKKVEQDFKLQNNDKLVQTYIDGLFSDEPAEAELIEQSETITSRIWTVFKALNPEIFASSPAYI